MNNSGFRSRLGVLGLSVRRFAAMMGVRDSATLGRCAERAPAGVPALGSADAGNDGPDGIRNPPEQAVRRPRPSSDEAWRRPNWLSIPRLPATRLLIASQALAMAD